MLSGELAVSACRYVYLHVARERLVVYMPVGLPSRLGLS